VITFIRVLTWSTASLGALLGGLAIERTSVAFVYEVVGGLIFLVALPFFMTPLRDAEKYMAQEAPAQGMGEEGLTG